METDEVLADIITNELEIDASRVVLYNQEFDAPKDSGIYVILSTGLSKTVSSSVKFNPDTNKEDKSISSFVQVKIDIVSKSRDAYERKEEIVMALTSFYSQRAQEDNNMRIFRNGDIIDLSAVEGSKSLHRFQVPVNINYLKTKSTSVDYYNKFRNPVSEVQA